MNKNQIKGITTFASFSNNNTRESQAGQQLSSLFFSLNGWTAIPIIDTFSSLEEEKTPDKQ